jgi:hypothetical protein
MKATYERVKAGECHGHDFDCTISNVQLALTILNMFPAYIYFVLYFWHIWRSMDKLKKLPRQDFKMANLSVRMQVCCLHLLC